MAHSAWLAYVPFVNDAPKPPKGDSRPEERNGRERLAELLGPGGFQLRKVFNQDNVQAFLAVNPDEFAVLAFRGTADLADWGIDLDAALAPMQGFDGVRVHEGFWNAYRDMSDCIRGAARLLRGQAPRTICRHDQGPLPRAWNYLWSLVLWPICRTLRILDDHMIWNYARRLDHIARTRAALELNDAEKAATERAAAPAAEQRPAANPADAPA